MVNGILGLLRDIHTDKHAEIERDHYSRCQEIEKKLARENPKLRELMNKINARTDQIEKLREEVNKLEETKRKLFPQHWEAKDRATKMLKEEYLNLRVKTTLNGIPKEQVKKMVEEFHNKDYLSIAMGA